MLDRVIAKNFQSWGDLEFQMSKGVTLVDGWNEDDQTQEGCGKSAILNAICWGGFGKLPKDVKIDEVIKDGESSCVVALIFSNGDAVVRSRKPNDVFVKRASGEVIKGKDARETQELIEEYIGCNFETFCQSVYFAQNYENKFLPSNQETKGKILSGIQNLQVFDKARKEVVDLLKIESDKLTRFIQKLEMEKNNIHHVQAKIKMVDSFIQTKKLDFQKSKGELSKKIQLYLNNVEFHTQAKLNAETELQETYEKLGVQSDAQETLGQEREAIASKLGNLVSQKSQLSNHNRTVNQMNVDGNRSADRYSKLQDKRQKLEAFLSNPSSNCPTCGAVLSNVDLSHTTNELDQVMLESNEVLSRLTDISNFLDSNKLLSIEELETEERQLRGRTLEIDRALSNMKMAQKRIDSLKYEIMAQQAEVASVTQNAEATKLQLSQMIDPDVTIELQNKENLSRELDSAANSFVEVESKLNQTKIYASQLEVLKDGFREIKSYVFNNALNELNYKTNEYLSQLFEVEAKIRFTNEDQKIESTIILDGREKSLGSLSGGQHRRFNLAVDLALSDIVEFRKQSKVDILIMDEYFKDLSEVSMEKCLELLKSRKCPVILVEHNSIFKNIVDKTFFVRLENGTSSHAAN